MKCLPEPNAPAYYAKALICVRENFITSVMELFRGIFFLVQLFFRPAFKKSFCRHFGSGLKTFHR
jgi:hypothetical protein